MDRDSKQIVQMMCPVCNKFYFSELSDVEIEQVGLTPNTTQCSVCGWFYDLEQVNDPELENQSNKMSLKQYRLWYKAKIQENPKWEYYQDYIGEPSPHKCPLCGEYTFQDELSYDICPVCGWQDCGYEEMPDEKQSSYAMSFNERKQWFAAKRQRNPLFRWDKDSK